MARKEKAETIAREFLRALYPKGASEIREIKWIKSPYEFHVTGRVNIRDDIIGERDWANFEIEILVSPYAQKVTDYTIQKTTR